MRHLLPAKYLLPLLFLSLLLSSCKKELEEIENDPEITWEAHKEFMHNERYITNLHADNDKLHVLGLYLFSTISHAGEETNVERYIHPFKNLSHNKYPINAHVFVGTEGNMLHFKSIKNPTSVGSELHIEMTSVDPDFRGFRSVSSLLKVSMAITDNNFALVPYSAYDQEKKQYIGLRYLLVKLSLDGSGFYEKIVLEEAKILRPFEDGGSMRYITAHGSDFYVSNDRGFFHISEEGEITRLMSDQIGHSVFMNKGNLNAITWNGPHRTVSLYKASAANSWALDQQLDGQADMLTYHAISDDVLLASYNSQLFEVEIGIDTFILRELDNAGLEGNFITSIAKVNDKVYIGTQSGLFSKSEEHLLTYKEEAK